MAALPRFVSVDIEATGPAPGLFSMVAIGAMVIDDPENTFYAEIEPITDDYDEAALKVAMPGRTHKSLYDTGEDPGLVMERFARWVEGLSDGGAFEPIMVAHNAPFDWMFVCWYLFRYSGRNPFGWAAIDTRALFMGLQHKRWRKTRLADIKKVYKTDRIHKHHALEDAIEQGELFATMLAEAGFVG